VAAHLHSPTQVTATLIRCGHGYYVEHRKHRSPPCPTCNPLVYSLDKELSSYALALLAMRAQRPKNDCGKFQPTASVSPGEYRCWCCREVKPLDAEHFRRDSTKSTGFQSRCKACDNSLKTAKRRGECKPGALLLMAVGAL